MSSDQSISIPLGIIIGLLASCVQSLGLTIQRKSHVINQLLPEHLQRVEHRRPLWLLGFAVFISSNILGSFVQIASLPVVILAPLGAVSLLWNAFFARFLLGDIFSPWMILGTIFIAAGAVLIAIFGILPEETRSLDDLLELFRRPTFIAYFSVLGFVLCVSLVITHLAEFSLSRKVSDTRNTDSPSIDLSITTANPSNSSTDSTLGIIDEFDASMLTNERTPLLDRKSGTESHLHHRLKQIPNSITRTRLIIAIAYASFSGIISGMCLLFAKSGVELLLLTMRGKNQFWRWEAWCLLLGLAVFALLQTWYLHKGLVLADPTIVCPSAFCLYNLSSIINGLVYFDQFSLIPPLHLMLVSIGIITLLGGVWVVSIQPSGGGVDLGTWDEEIVPLSDGVLGAIREGNEEVPTNEHTPLLEPLANTHQEATRPEYETRSESSLQFDKLGIGKWKTQKSVSPDGRMLHHGIYASPRVSSVRAASASMSCDPQRARVLSSPVESELVDFSQTNAFPFPLSRIHNNTVAHGPFSSALGSALQIGLSPVSPGFAILPVERKKTNPYVTGGDGEVSGNTGPGRRHWRMQRRRTVSDGEVSRIVRGMMEELPDVQSVHTEDSLAGGTEIEPASLNPWHDNQAQIVPQTRTDWRRLMKYIPRWKK